jgi:hypothetical protein
MANIVYYFRDPEYKIFIATSVKFDDNVFDNAADAAKEVTGISNAARGDDIISNAKPMLDSDDGDQDKDEAIANPKAVAQGASVNTQDITNQDHDAEGQEVDETLRCRSRTCHRRPHGFLPLARHELRTRRLSLWLWRLPIRTNGSRPLTRESTRWRMQAPVPWFHTSQA